MRRFVSCIGLLLLFMLAVGCQKGTSPAPAPAPQAEAVIGDVRSYFPMDAKLTWTYQGEGNEYASFTRRVMFQQDNRAQFSEVNGGTRMVMVFQSTPEAITKTYFVPEFYTEKNVLSEQSNHAEILLKAPLKAGSSWQDATSKREVMGIQEKVTVPAGTFENVVKIKVTSLQGQNANTATYEYYAPNSGLVLREFSSDAFKVVSKLLVISKTEQEPVARPQTKQSTFALEGMRQETTLTLVEGMPLPFITYLPQDLVAERAVSSSGTSFKFFANFAGKKRTDVYRSLFFYAPGTSIEQAQSLIESMAHQNGWQVIERQSEKRYRWATREWNLQHKTGSESYTGSVAIAKHNDIVFHMVTYYLPEFTEGFGPRANLILQEFVWTDTNESLNPK